MDCVKVLVLFGNIWLRRWNFVTCLNQSWIHACLWETKWFAFVTLMISCSELHNLVMQLRELGVDLEQEDDAAGFLGVRLERVEGTNLLEMKQTGLIDRVIETLGLDVGTVNGKATPAERAPLVKDEDGPIASGDFSYSSVVGMLLYLSGHSRPDIAYAVNCAARYMCCPKQ
jgi:hypothetical protein